MTRDPIELLRKYLEVPALFSERNGYRPFDREPALRMLDEIEAQYMKLPVDADGVPIRPGDVLEGTIPEMTEPFTAYFVGRDGEILDDETSFHHANRCCHVKPDTVESLLHEMAREVESDDWMYCSGRVIEEYAEKIRRAQ